ncbi:MAG: M48 family peptidase [Actinobacteria bacterium]|nr:M48 family peptidase [Actinomycetota bacterium]NBY15254.1 M48 family peptidase [Actinomycetota bacterium]
MDQHSEVSLFDFIDDETCASETIESELEISVSEFEVEIQRSKRRRKTSSAYRRGGKIIVQVPARLSQREVDATVAELVRRIEKQEQVAVDPKLLMERAKYLVDIYLGEDIIGNHRVPVTLKWVTNQNSRWGSCTPATGVIRLSHRLISMPQYVQDAVIFHELIHLVVISHNADFYRLLNKLPHLEKANAYLDGYSHALTEKS